MSAIASKSVQTPIGEAAARRPPAAVPDYIERNRAEWERWSPKYVERGREAWAADELRWGIWGIPEDELRLVADLEAGADVIELGCGTAAICAWLARRGFSPTGVDVARPMLETAAEFEREFGVGFPLLCANAEQLHFEDASFDCAISEYGVSLWCNPQRWVAEAARLLRPNGLLVFVTNSSHLISCTPDDGGLAGDRLVRDYFSRYWVEFEGSDAVEFHLNHGNWVRLLRTNGFVLEDLVETRPSEGATPRTPFASAEWAQRWPSEEIWVARKAPPASLSDEASESEDLAATDDVQEPPETLESQGHPERHHPLREHVAASGEHRADGALRDADGAGADLAASLVEEVQILAPPRAAATDVPEPVTSPTDGTGVVDATVSLSSATPAATDVSAPDSSPTDGTGVVDSTVSLSSASLEELAQLPKVGPVTAQRIVEYRIEHGPFESVDDLVAVPGFGLTRVEQLREFVRP